jgi:hypothetical protein
LPNGVTVGFETGRRYFQMSPEERRRYVRAICEEVLHWPQEDDYMGTEEEQRAFRERQESYLNLSGITWTQLERYQLVKERHKRMASAHQEQQRRLREDYARRTREQTLPRDCLRLFRSGQKYALLKLQGLSDSDLQWYGFDDERIAELTAGFASIGYTRKPDGSCEYQIPQALREKLAQKQEKGKGGSRRRSV